MAFLVKKHWPLLPLLSCCRVTLILLQAWYPRQLIWRQPACTVTRTPSHARYPVQSRHPLVPLNTMLAYLQAMYPLHSTSPLDVNVAPRQALLQWMLRAAAFMPRQSDAASFSLSSPKQHTSPQPLLRGGMVNSWCLPLPGPKQQA